MELGDEFFANGDVVERPVKLPDGTIRNLHFKPCSGLDYTRYSQMVGSKDQKVKALAPAALVAACLCGPKGEAVLSVERAAALRAQVFTQMFGYAMLISGMTTLAVPDKAASDGKVRARKTAAKVSSKGKA